MTNNFERVIGEGGFGVVYHGYLNDSEQVAVKVLSPSSSQGYKEFKAEEILLQTLNMELTTKVLWLLLEIQIIIDEWISLWLIG